MFSMQINLIKNIYEENSCGCVLSRDIMMNRIGFNIYAYIELKMCIFCFQGMSRIYTKKLTKYWLSMLKNTQLFLLHLTPVSIS